MTDPRRYTTYLDDARSLIFGEFTGRSWARMGDLMEQIGITWPDNEGLGKEKYVSRELASASVAQIEKIARWFVVHPEQTLRKADFEDAVSWIETDGQKQITDVTRQRLLRELEGLDLVGQISVDEFIKLVGREPEDRLRKYVKGPGGIHSYSLMEQLVDDRFVTGQRAGTRRIPNRDCAAWIVDDV